MSNRVVKEKIIRDSRGRIIGRQMEQLVDNGHGIYSKSIQEVIYCSGCGRPLTDVTQWQGQCDCCGDNICVFCISKCQTCGRRLCRRCRRSFVGERLLRVCCR